MLDMSRVVEAWDWHVAGQAVRVFRPDVLASAAVRRRGVCEPWGFSGLLGAAWGKDAAPVFWDAAGDVSDSASGRLALLAAEAWEQGRRPAEQIPVALVPALPVAGPLAGLFRVPGPLGGVALVGRHASLPLDFDHLDAVTALAAEMREQAGAPGALAVVADIGQRRVVGIRASGACWRGPADALPAALSAAEALGCGAAALSGDWRGLANLPVAVCQKPDGVSLGARAYLIALRRFYDRPGAMPPFVLS